MASSASSLHFLSLTPNTLSRSNLSPNPTSFSLLSLSSPSNSISLSASYLRSARPFEPTLSSKFVRNVAISSDVEQDEDDSVVDNRRFSEDLKLFVGNLPFNIDSATLAELFGQAGNVEMVEVIYDKITGRSRGFGFVTMSTVEEVEAAAQQFNGYELDGRPLRVNAGPPPQRSEDSFRGGARGGGGGSFDNTNRLYVGNLSYGVDNSALENLFSKQGKVVDAKVIYDRDSGRSKGFGFVTLSSADEVNSAIESLDGYDLEGRSIRVTIAESRPPRPRY